MAPKSDIYSELQELKDVVTELQQKNREQDSHIKALEKDQGIEGALMHGFGRLETALQINALGPVYKFGEGEAQVVAELRSSLARPNFDALETNLGRTPFPPDQAGDATYQQRT